VTGSLENRLNRVAAQLAPERTVIHGPWCPPECDHATMPSFTLKLALPQDALMPDDDAADANN
jgi:hypothetical protein